MMDEKPGSRRHAGSTGRSRRTMSCARDATSSDWRQASAGPGNLRRSMARPAAWSCRGPTDSGWPALRRRDDGARAQIGPRRWLLARRIASPGAPHLVLRKKITQSSRNVANVLAFYPPRQDLQTLAPTVAWNVI